MECCACFGGAREPSDRPGGLDAEALAELVRQRTEALTASILNGPLNQAALPDFIERRLLYTVIHLVFNVVVTLLLEPGAPPSRRRRRL